MYRSLPHRPANLGFLVVVCSAALSAIGAAEDARRFIEPNALQTSRAVIVGNVPLAHTAQVLPFDEQGEVVGTGDAAEQAKFLLTRLDEVLREAGSSLEQIVKLNLYAASDDAAKAMLRAIMKRFTGNVKPAYSLVVTRMTNDKALVSLDAVAVAPAAQTKPTTSVAILPPGRKIYVAGQAEKGDDLKSATQKTIDSLRRTLKFLGRTDADIVQLKAFVKRVTAEAEQQVREALAASLGDAPLRR